MRSPDWNNQDEGESVANYAIMRCKKLTGMGSVASALSHCYRMRETANADLARTPDNEHRASESVDAAMGRLRELLPEKRRSNSVLAVEYMMSASPEWWKTATPEQQKSFFRESLSWLERKYGADRVITATVHRDELTPHLSAFVVPVTADGRLSARDFIGGRAKLQADQSSFAARMQFLGLHRGIQGSTATHKRVKQHYAEIARPIRSLTIEPVDVTPKVLKKSLFGTTVESAETVAKRLTAEIARRTTTLLEKARELEVTQRRLRVLEDAQSELKQLNENAANELRRQYEKNSELDDRLFDYGERLGAYMRAFPGETMESLAKREKALKMAERASKRTVHDIFDSLDAALTAEMSGKQPEPRQEDRPERKRTPAPGFKMRP